MPTELPQHPASANLVPTYPHWILHLQRQFAQKPNDVWAAITEPEKVASWAPFRPDRNLGSRGPVRLTMLDGDETYDCEVLDEVPNESLAYTWDTDRLRFSLTENDGGTRLTLAHTMDDRNSAASVAAGWHLCLSTMELLLAGKDVPSVTGEKAKEYGWAELQREYEALFDAERVDERVHEDEDDESEKDV